MSVVPSFCERHGTAKVSGLCPECFPLATRRYGPDLEYACGPDEQPEGDVTELVRTWSLPCGWRTDWFQASWGRYPGAPRPPAPIEKTGPWMGGLTSDENGRRLP